MNFKNEPILSRKVALRSMTRHFAGWKVRHFTLDRTNQVLEVVTQGGKRTVVELRSASVTKGRHHYAVDEFHWFWIKYFDVSEVCYKEIIMKFKDLADMERWEQALKAIDISYQNYLHESIPLLVDIFSDLIEEAAQSLKIVKEVQSEDEQKATYFHHSSGAETHGSVEAASNLMNSFMMATEDDASEIQPAEPNSNQLNVYQSRLYERCLSSSTIPTQQDKLHHSGVHINVFPAASHNQESLSNTNPLLGQSEKKTFGFRYPYPKMRKLSVPKLNILIMAVGTRGDIQPFRQFGMRLKEDGHRVRLATHELFRSYILEKGLEFYPLAGDPILLSEFMGKTGGSILPLSTEILKEVPKFHTMICDIVSSAWKSCLEPDPKDEDAKPFAADVIISNPVTYGHCHCAEALGIPLHLMFPQVRLIIIYS
jgi:hypothetical protein